jgi:ketose-bisphosphate aldolase
MKLLNAKQICDIAAAKGFGVPALNNNGGSYDIGRAIIEAAQELQSPLIIAEYEPNLEYCGYEHAGAIIRMHAADTTIPIAIALDHGKTPQSIFRAIKAGFTHVMIDYADKSLDENVRGTQQIIDLVRPLGISVEAEIGHIIKSSDESQQRGGTVSVAEAKEFASKVDVDLLAVANGSTHGIFKEQHGMDFKLIPKIRAAEDAVGAAWHLRHFAAGHHQTRESRHDQNQFRRRHSDELHSLLQRIQPDFEP